MTTTNGTKATTCPNCGSDEHVVLEEKVTSTRDVRVDDAGVVHAFAERIDSEQASGPLQFRCCKCTHTWNVPKAIASAIRWE